MLRVFDNKPGHNIISIGCDKSIANCTWYIEGQTYTMLRECTISLQYLLKGSCSHSLCFCKLCMPHQHICMVHDDNVMYAQDMWVDAPSELVSKLDFRKHNIS